MMNRTAQDALWLARALIVMGSALVVLGFAFAFGGALGSIIAAVMVPGIVAVAAGAGIGLLILRDEKRRSRNVDVVNLKPTLPTEDERIASNINAWLDEVYFKNEDRNGGR